MKRSFVLAALVLASAVTSAAFLFGASASGIKLAISDVGSAAPAATFTVNNVNDSGAGSLRNAITQANASPGADLINFDIGTGTPSIAVGALGLGPLPHITEAVTIDGATGGATRVELNGTQAGGVELNGTQPGAVADGLVIVSGNCTIRGLVINRFNGNGIAINTNGTNVVQGNFIGTDAAGTVALGNTGEAGVRIDGSANNSIGGTTPGAGNLISGNGGVGVLIINVGATNNTVAGNLIGTNASGTAALGNSGNGVVIDSDSSANTIGGPGAGAGNVISGNGNGGVQISTATGNVVQGNLIGTDSGGANPLANNGSGIRVFGSSAGNTIGGVVVGAGNRVAFNVGAGVNLLSGTQNTVLANAIFANGFLGINLSDDAVTPNDACDGDSGANELQNFPDLVSASSDGSSTTIQGSLNSTANTDYRIEVFSSPACDSSGNGQGAIFIGAASAVAGPSCLAPIDVNLPVAVTSGQFITATATDPQGNTSEFSACVLVTSPDCVLTCPLDITRASDPGACGAVTTYPPPTTDGGCFGEVSCDPPSGSFFPTGVTTVTCTTEAAPSCSFTITINDTEPPVVTCPNNQTTPATGPGGAPLDYPAPMVVDNCPGASAICAPASGSLFPVGVTTVSCTATDASNNSSNCAFTITVTAQADLSITKNGSPNPVGSGTNLTYAIAVNNGGPSAATGVTVTDAVPAGTTFVSVTTSQGTSTAPPVGGTGIVTCSLGTIPLGGTANVTLVVKVNATPGSTINNSASVTGTSNDPNTENNSSTAMTPVIFSPCAINCPADVTASTLPPPFDCGARVSYPVPTTIGGCGAVICAPPPNSFFPAGVTVVTCTTESESSCSFNVTVTDTTAPRITCSGNISTSPPPGQSSVVVRYAAPGVVENCSGGTATCTPPSGSTFGLGTSSVTCTSVDTAGNTSTCSFSITVIDNNAPTITCPPPVTVDAAPGQCTPIVNYPQPTVTDNAAGSTVVCTPPSGSTFPVGITTVSCTAIDVFGNRSTCTFALTVRDALPTSPIPLSLSFGEETPVTPVRKPKKNPPSSCDCSKTFAIENTSCSVLGLNLASISREGSDVATGRITNPDDTRFFSLRVVNSDGSERPVPQNCGDFCIEIAPGQSQTFRVVFNPVIPAPTGKTTGLAARDVLPEEFASTIIFTTNRGTTLPVNLFAHVGTALQLINASNPKKPASARFTRSGDEFILTYSIFDANLDTTRARYEMLDGSGAVVGEAIEVDLTQPIVDGLVFKGQSFIVTQRFLGARDNTQITSVRLTVFDAEANASITTQLRSSASSGSPRSNSRALPIGLQPRIVGLAPKPR